MPPACQFREADGHSVISECDARETRPSRNLARINAGGREKCNTSGFEIVRSEEGEFGSRDGGSPERHGVDAVARVLVGGAEPARLAPADGLPGAVVSVGSRPADPKKNLLGLVSNPYSSFVEMVSSAAGTATKERNQPCPLLPHRPMSRASATHSV